MATVVNLFPDRRFESAGFGLGAGVGGIIQDRRRREAARQRQEAISQALNAPLEEYGGPTNEEVMTSLLGAGFEANEAMNVAKRRDDQSRQKRMDTDFSDFFRLTEDGSMNSRDALLEIGNPDLVQTLSQGGFLGKDETITLFRPSGEERQARIPTNAQLNDETLRMFAPEAFSLGFRLERPTDAVGGRGAAGTADKSDRDATAILRNMNLDINPENLAKARDFVNQREQAFNDIETTLGEVNQATGAVFIAPGATQDVVNEAKALLRDTTILSEDKIPTRRAVGQAIEEARRKVSRLEHLELAEGSSSRDAIEALKNRGWEEDEVIEAFEGINALNDRVRTSIEEVYGSGRKDRRRRRRR